MASSPSLLSHYSLSTAMYPEPDGIGWIAETPLQSTAPRQVCGMVPIDRNLRIGYVGVVDDVAMEMGLLSVKS